MNIVFITLVCILFTEIVYEFLYQKIFYTSLKFLIVIETFKMCIKYSFNSGSGDVMIFKHDDCDQKDYFVFNITYIQNYSFDNSFDTFKWMIKKPSQ